MHRTARALLAVVVIAAAIGCGAQPPEPAARAARAIPAERVVEASAVRRDAAPNDGTRSDVYAFGSARFLGANRGPLADDIVGMNATGSGRGYWLVAQDGGIFA